MSLFVKGGDRMRNRGDILTEEEKINIWISILRERRRKYIEKNWIEKAPTPWPIIHEYQDGALLCD